MNPLSPPPLYVINLDSDLSRRESLLFEASKLDLKITRISAVWSGEILETDANYVSLGIRAIWLSHLKAMEAFLESSADFAIIAEDDFEVTKPLELQKYLNSTLTYEFDLVQFGFLITGIDIWTKVWISNIQLSIFKVLGKVSNIRILRRLHLGERMRIRDAIKSPRGFVPFNCEPGAHFYLISRFFATQVIKLNEPQFLSMDDFYSALAKMRAFKMARVSRSLVRQKNFESLIGERFKAIPRDLA